MKINQKLFDKIAETTLMGGQGEIQISLFQFSKDRPGIKKLNLESLTPKQRKEELRKLAEEDCFIAVIGRMDAVFAHIHEKHLDKLKGSGDLTMNGKVITWQGLSDKQYEEEMTLILEVFLEALEQELKNPKKKDADTDLEEADLAKPAQKGAEVGPELPLKKSKETLRLEIAAKQGDMLVKNMRRLSEERREERELEKQENLREDIKRREIKKQILSHEIVSENVSDTELQRDIISDDASSKGKA